MKWSYLRGGGGGVCVPDYCVRCVGRPRSVGMSVDVIGLGMSAMGVADLALTPVAGVLMDTRGRKTVGWDQCLSRAEPTH